MCCSNAGAMWRVWPKEASVPVIISWAGFRVAETFILERVIFIVNVLILKFLL